MYKSMFFCEHANESPRGICDCSHDCGCREFMCRVDDTNHSGNWIGRQQPLSTEEHVAAIRKFATGAIRDSNTDKPDYFGFTSALVTKRYGEFMHKNRKLPDGSMRGSDNWKMGLNPKDTVESFCRHVEDVKLHFEGHPEAAKEDIESALCAVIFNSTSMLLELLKARNYQLTPPNK